MTPSWSAWGRSAARFGIGAVVVAAIVGALALPSEPAAWSVVALVVVLGATTGQSVTASINRMVGSVVGCLTGAIVQIALPGLWLPLRVGLAVVVCMLACRLMRVGAGQRLGMALAGFFVFVPGDQEWQMVGWRLLATIVGIAVALVIVLVLWPASARDRLITGISATAMAIASALEAVGRRSAGETGTPPSTPIPPLAPLRPLVSERRYEPGGRGPDAHVLSGVLDGLELAVTGVRRLEAAYVVGPEGLLRVIAPQLRSVLDELGAVCAAIASMLTGGSVGSVLLPGDVDHRLSVALEELRAAHLTPAADAAELRDLFGVVESLSLTAQGLAAAGSALAAART